MLWNDIRKCGKVIKLSNTQICGDVVNDLEDIIAFLMDLNNLQDKYTDAYNEVTMEKS